MAITDDEIQRLRAASVRDNCFNILVPSDVRLLLDELERLRKENARLEEVAQRYSVMFDNEAFARGQLEANNNREDSG